MALQVPDGAVAANPAEARRHGPLPKFAVFDGGVVLTGSYNWTRGTAENNEENLVLSNDRRLLDAFGREFASSPLRA